MGRKFGDAKEHKSAFVVVVLAKPSKDQLQNLLIPEFKTLAKYVAENEEGTLCYELSVSDDENAAFSAVINERYISKEYCDTVHMKSQAFQQFVDKLKAGGIDLFRDCQIITGTEQDIGFVSG
eukprot:jgi/Chrzof1/4943/Cz15g05140.t1